MTRDDEDRPIKVTDRRMFTADGELRESANGAEDQQPEVDQPEPIADRQNDRDRSSVSDTDFAGSLPEPSFGALVSVLAEPAALFLGDAPLPDGSSTENLELARFHIDLLDLLKRKTQSNLSQDELALLDSLLYQLRMRYVQKSQ